VGRAFGLDADVLVDAINASTGRNNSTENKLKQFILNESYAEAGFALELMAKDVALAAALGDAMGQKLPGLSAARALWAQAREGLSPGADHTEIYRFLAEMPEQDTT
ncbi:MAG: NAD-binding protein, partial [Rhodobacterales bacterium]